MRTECFARTASPLARSPTPLAAASVKHLPGVRRSSSQSSERVGSGFRPWLGGLVGPGLSPRREPTLRMRRASPRVGILTRRRLQLLHEAVVEVERVGLEGLFEAGPLIDARGRFPASRPMVPESGPERLAPSMTFGHDARPFVGRGATQRARPPASSRVLGALPDRLAARPLRDVDLAWEMQ